MTNESNPDGKLVIVKKLGKNKWQPGGSVLTFKTLKAAQNYMHKRFAFERAVAADLNEHFSL